ncbi:hypothetical protein HMPREF9015_01486 [Leptotrichia wadei F0279]|uniref:Uncharacterized protein n=1 Tax=Leptotrichia wadei (strain F0279) TaxID=888055 RepID=U2PF25_LEPWF|nr:hypothetical protein HMPREF9015_01486 [Leptotrichia wadei F0279]
MYKNKFYPIINFEEELTLKKQYFEFEKQFKSEEKNTLYEYILIYYHLFL